jgi:FkbM family methyltransferase
VLGLYDRAGFRVLNELLVKRRLLPVDSSICDIGAHIGLYSAFFATKVALAGKVYAFEAAPPAFKRLVDFVTSNQIANVIPENLVCTNRIGTAEFFVCSNLYCSSSNLQWAAHHGATQRVEVAATTLDEYFLERGLAWPEFIKLDVEGCGADVLQGTARCIREKRPILWVESHNREEERAISLLIKDFDYRAFCPESQQWVRKPDDLHPNPNGVRSTMILSAGDRLGQVEAALG